MHAYGNTVVTGETSPSGSQADMAAMLAELTSRLELLAQELDSARNEPEPADPAPRALHAVAPATTPVPDVSPHDALSAVVGQTLEHAEQEARQVLADASRRIAEIRARTRTLLALALAASSGVPAPAATARRPLHPAPAEDPERRVYDGAVMVEVGPFTNVVQLSDFEEALASVPGVVAVDIRNFERRQAHFELHTAQPTALIAELQARAPDALYVIEAAERLVRLEIFTDEPD